MNVKLLTSLALLCLLVAVGLPATAADTPMAQSADLILDATDFQAGTHQGTAVTPAGLSLAPQAVAGHYVSPAIEAPLAFNAVVPQWLADAPEAASMTIRLRTGTAAGWWSDWFTIHENDDWTLPEDPDRVGQMIVVPAVDSTHSQVQVSISFSRYAGSPAVRLQELKLTFIDSTHGPTAEELVARQEALDGIQQQAPESGYSKPAVVSRQVWCTAPECNYSDGLEYRSVTHLIVHHTVSSNSSSDWAATVRAIWQFHTFSRKWGDIGYNYLVDMNGVLYEGHLGGDDVVGTHASAANAGSMALSFIGTFTAANYPNLPGIAPPPAMKNAAAELFAWKADQKNIDVYSASRLPNMSWGLPHLMGHRDVYGGTNTECPGDQAHDIIPWLRDEISRRIGFVTPYVYVSETSSAFSMSNSGNWSTAKGQCGYNGHAYYTWSTTDPNSSTNWGEWRPNLPIGDFYEVQVYAPYCDTDRGETYGATYTISHANGTSTVVANHQDNVGLWMSLGTFYFNAGNGGKIRLTDLTTSDSGRGVWFDDIRLRPSSALPDPTVANLEPKPTTWSQQRNITFKWDVTNPTVVSKSKVQVATDPDFNSLTLDQELAGAPTSYSHTFGADYARLYWRVRLTTTQGRTITSAATDFGIDTQAPSSRVNYIYKLEDDGYVLSWSGSDATSGVTGYNIDYREEGGQWQRWLSNKAYHSAPFTPPPQSQKYYEFRSQAIDGAGNLEGEHTSVDVSSRGAILLRRAIIQPLLFW